MISNASLWISAVFKTPSWFKVPMRAYFREVPSLLSIDNHSRSVSGLVNCSLDVTCSLVFSDPAGSLMITFRSFSLESLVWVRLKSTTIWLTFLVLRQLKRLVVRIASQRKSWKRWRKSRRISLLPSIVYRTKCTWSCRLWLSPCWKFYLTTGWDRGLYPDVSPGMWWSFYARTIIESMEFLTLGH